MKNHLHRFAPALAAIISLLPFSALAQDNPKVSTKTEVRVLGAPDRERRVMVQYGPDSKAEKETVAFLGVEAGPVSAALSAQLSLARGTGLVVNHVVAKSPAAAVLREHDILLKLDDQILIETRQLSVLIRGHRENDEVTVTYLRAGQKATATIKLGKQEVPKFSGTAAANLRAFPAVPVDQSGGVERFTAVPEGEREHLDRVLGLIGRARGAPDTPPGSIPPPVRIEIERAHGPGIRAMSINTGNSSMVFSDDEGALELTMAGGGKTLVAKNPKGEKIFSGPVTTPDERKALPSEIRARLEKLEGMHDISFRTDGSFKGVEEKTVRPRGIVFPQSSLRRGAPVPDVL